MEPVRPPKDPLFDLWLNAQVTAATQDTMMKYLCQLVAAQRGRTYEEVREEMEADRDVRVRAYLRQNRSK